MRTVLLFLFCYAFGHAQQNCDNAQLLSERINFKYSDSVAFFKIKQDSGVIGAKITGDFQSAIFSPKECPKTNNSSSTIIDSSGQVMISESLILSGQCYCPTCLERNSWQKFNKDSIIYVKVLQPKSVQLTFKKTPAPPKKWFETPLKKGTKINLQEILFVGGEAKFLPSSYTELELLENALINNPNVHILIMGHVNAPNQRNTRKNQQLSEKRAKAVVDHLISKGINGNRLKFKGYGNTRMVYPNAETQELMKLNRRVEILITKD